MKKVIITGVTGQDGSHMADFLLNNTDSYIIAGIRRLSVDNHDNIKHLKNHPRFRIIDLDITDQINVERVIQDEKPDYFINLAANSFVGNSWTMPVNHMTTNCMAVLYQLEAIKKHCPECRYYNAGSSEEFGNVSYSPQDEKHPIKPRSPYGAAKSAARMLVKVYRESYGLYAVQGWLFNHEGVRRGKEFVTRKITQGVARIFDEVRKGEEVNPIELGNLDAKRDWSDAEDFVEGIWRMLNQESFDKELSKKWKNWGKMVNPPATDEQAQRKDNEYFSKNIKEYVLSSNETHSIREFVEEAFAFAGFGKDECQWIGSGVQEKYMHGNQVLVKINPKYYRPAEVDLLFGDSSQARERLNWSPKSNFLELVRKMVNNDLNQK